MTLVKFNNGTRRDLSNVSFLSPMFTDIFDGLLHRDSMFTEAGSFMPAVNVSETEKEYQIDAFLPGMKKEDVKIAIDNKVLTISGEHKVAETEEKRKYSRREFRYGSFKRSFTLPETVSFDEIAAEYNEGVLLVKVPKREVEKTVKEVKIS